jgi:hypothetical protein
MQIFLEHLQDHEYAYITSTDSFKLVKLWKGSKTLLSKVEKVKLSL